MNDIQKENIHRQRKNKTNEKPNKLCAHTITRQARTTSNNTILSMIILLPIILIKMNENENAFSTIYHIKQH